MTEIMGHWESYLSLPKLLFMDSRFRIHGLTPLKMGVYDINLGRIDESYIPGRFLSDTGEPFFDDTIYSSKEGYNVCFKHSVFGNFPGLRMLGGHYHIQHIVSTNSIRPQDVMHENENGDLIFFGSIARWPPHEITQYDGTEEILIEITPFLSSSELERLSKDANFMLTVKEKYIASEAKKQELNSKLIVARTEATASTAVVMQLQEKINNLLKNHQITLEKVMELRLYAAEKLNKGLEMIEGKYNLNLPMDRVVYEDTERTAASLQADIRELGAMMKLNGELSDNQKQILLLQVANVVGIPFMRQFLLGIEQHNVSTPAGQKRLTISNSPTPTEMIVHYAQMLENKDISPADFSKAMEGIMGNMNNQIGKSASINGAIQDIKTDFLKKARPEEAHVIQA